MKEYTHLMQTWMHPKPQGYKGFQKKEPHLIIYTNPKIHYFPPRPSHNSRKYSCKSGLGQTSGELGVQKSEVKGCGLHRAEHAFGQESATS